MAISEKEHKRNTKQFLVYSLIFICIIAVGIYVKQKGERGDEQLDKHGASTIGWVYYTQNSTRGLWVKYNFKVENKTIKGVFRTHKKGINVGQKYEVEYLPANPEINRINLNKKLNAGIIND
jgi:hypothetical protein